jgi:4a-hydroxytetrahydrobiopterin dehydratase|tara:strand:- start:80 stop:376 length:297 start_codon:yes stop_codon:yes gene_type:complete
MACDSSGTLDSLAAADLPDGWRIEQHDEIDHLIKQYRFKNFVSAMHFSNEIAELAELYNHHPMIVTEWGKVSLHWWTHTAKGITELDLKLARLSDGFA